MTAACIQWSLLRIISMLMARVSEGFFFSFWYELLVSAAAAATAYVVESGAAEEIQGGDGLLLQHTQSDRNPRFSDFNAR